MPPIVYPHGHAARATGPADVPSMIPGTRAAWAAGAFAALVAAAGLAPRLPVALAVPALAATFALVPGAWLVRRVLAGDGLRSAAAAPLLGIAATGALAVGLRSAGIGPVTAARIVAAGAALLALHGLWRARATRGWAALGPDGLMALGLAGALAALELALPELARRSDGAFHAGVVWSATRAIPPEDPFFAGLPLRYFWGWHAWAGQWLALVPGAGPHAPLVASGVLALGSLALAVAGLARRLGGGTRTALLAQALALAGTAPFAWFVLAARTATGEVRGLAELRRSLSLGADFALRSLDPGLSHASLVAPFDKFVVMTPFAWALAGATLLAAELLRGEARGRALLAPAALVSAMAFLHPPAAVPLGAAAVTAWLAAAGFDPATRTLALRRAAGAALGTALGLLSPGAFAASVGAGPLEAPRLLGTGAWSAAYGGALVVPAAFAALLAAGSRRERRPLALWLGAVLLPGVLLALAGDNQSKFLNLAFVIAAAPAALAWSRVARTRGRALALAGFLLVAQGPTAAAMFAAYRAQGPASVDTPARTPPALARALREDSAPDAVVLDLARDTGRGVAPGLPGDAGRSIVWGGDFLARKWGWPASETAWRRAAGGTAAAGGGTGAAPASLARREWWALAPDTAATWAGWRPTARSDGLVLLRRTGP